jgi:hypothetical protein
MQDTLLDSVEAALDEVITDSAALLPVLVIGAPQRFRHPIYNTAVVIHRGRVLGALSDIRHWLQVFAQRFYFCSNSSAQRCPTARRFPMAGHCHRAATGRHPREMSARIWLDEIAHGAAWLSAGGTAATPSKSARLSRRP